MQGLSSLPQLRLLVVLIITVWQGGIVEGRRQSRKVVDCNERFIRGLRACVRGVVHHGGAARCRPSAIAPYSTSRTPIAIRERGK